MRIQPIAEFAAKRRTDQDDLEKSLYPLVAEAVKAFPAVDWYNDLLREVGRAYLDVFHREGGTGEPQPSVADFVADVRSTLDKTDDPDTNTVDRVSIWLSTAILNAGTTAAAATDEEFVVMEWVTMHDSDVREAHRETEGQQRPPGEAFDVAGFAMAYPGDPTAPIELWINCRCSTAPVLGEQAENFSATEDSLAASTEAHHDEDGPQEDTMTATTEETEVEAPMLTATPWYGVLAPEGIYSGDGRKFVEDSLTWRDLPLPMTWQKASGQGHDGSVTVSKIERIVRVDNQLRGSGHFLSTPESDEVIGVVAEFGRFGVSVDADDAEFEFDDASGKVDFQRARISSASIVAIPAFAEAFIALGDAPPGFMPEDEAVDVCDPKSPDYDATACAESERAESEMSIEMVSEGSWDGSAGRFTDEQWKSSCVLHLADTLNKSDHKLPIKEPGGALSRAGVHAAASRFNQVEAPSEAKARAKASLRGAYKTLGEEPPDVLKASAVVETYGRGPGWLTNPADTKRLHDYWTKPGEEGYAKVGWGVPGDFNRCRVQVGEEIAENSPEDMVYLNQICAQWHHDAIGIWPGEHRTGEATPFTDLSELAQAEMVASRSPAPALSLVSSNGFCAPSEWFKNPGFTEGDERMVQQRDGTWLAPLTITDEGRVFGHLAGWKTCHAAYQGTCVAPPRSETGYAYFLTGEVVTDAGRVAVGQVTYDTGHAKPGGLRPALAHYDNTGTVVADVTCGEDEFGIWLAGWVRPGTPEEKVVGLRASVLSGDWRTVNPVSEEMELIAALAVNSGGFPIPRIGVNDGVQVSLVAAGVVTTSGDAEETVVEHLVQRVLSEMSARDRRRQRLAELSARVGGQD